MKIFPIIKVCMVFNSLKEQYSISSEKIRNEYGLYCSGYMGWTKNGLFFSQYSLEGSPDRIINFLKDEKITKYFI